MQFIAKLTNISKTYNYQYIFKPVNLLAHSKEAWHICGKNGSGKSTLLKIIAGICNYTGSCQIQSSLAYIGHQPGLYGQLTAEENLKYFTTWHASNTNNALIKQLFKDWQLPGHLPIDLLSAGQRQSVGLLCLVALNRKCWLLDEPTQCLDCAKTRFWFNLCQNHLKNGGLIFFTSHIKNDLLIELATNTILLQEY